MQKYKLLTISIVRLITHSLNAATNYVEIIATEDFTKNIPENLLKSKNEIGKIIRAEVANGITKELVT